MGRGYRFVIFEIKSPYYHDCFQIDCPIDFIACVTLHHLGRFTTYFFFNFFLLILRVIVVILFQCFFPDSNSMKILQYFNASTFEMNSFLKNENF